MNKQFLKDAFFWGFMVWLIGYGLGIVFFTIVPHDLIGWFVMPIGIIVSLWVLIKQIKSRDIKHYLGIAIVWTLIAVICDYFFLVRAFTTTSVYYKPDVYLYYALTFLLPILVGFRKSRTIE
ncbi:MAG TPA: hypothetical protein VHE53_00770 [Patescibacteria group bacterium]|nr:hypothetical protein [Patescibacteria group bacterium]